MDCAFHDSRHYPTVERMKRNILAISVITLFLFLIPFFWFKPGELDLGGDSSRLYFYDPIAYLHSQPLYGITTSGIGGESISYYSIPFIVILAAVKSIVKSPTILVNIFQGLTLSIAFLSCYFIIKEFAKELSKNKTRYVEWAAILSGVYYVLSPTLILGWDKAILTHYQFFLNPLMFLLLLKFLTKDNIKYLFTALLISFIFAANFSFVAAPPFFAFYPLAILFLLLYVKLIVKKPLPIWSIGIGLLMFLLIHIFHLGPQVLSLFSGGSEINTAVFSDEAKYSRGLSYFSAIAPSIKASYSLMNLAQMTNLGIYSFGFIIFPILLLFAFKWNKSRIYLLSGIFFLITLFFVTANITGVGLRFYKSLFDIPGFSMFRNYFGQWIFVFTFFYTILLGQALMIAFEKLRTKYSIVISLVAVIVLLGNAIPFINGNLVNKIHHESKNIKVPNKIDPEYDNVLFYIRNIPHDGKFISLPLMGPGYQIVSGENGGAYQGPSTITYLTGKNDFTGYDGLMPFNETFLQLVKTNDISGINRLFALLNIKYVFYNSDPKIYDDTFPKYPYDHVRDYMPKTQAEYKKFIAKLPIKKIKSFGNKYHIYEVDNFLPHIYAADNIVHASDALTPYFVLDSKESIRTVVFTDDVPTEKNAPVVIEATNINPLNELVNNYHLHVHEPFISRRPDDILYPLVIAREKNTLRSKERIPSDYLDYSMLHLSKRVFELEKYKQTPVIYEKFIEPKLWELHRWKNYYSWKSNLTRYESGMIALIYWISSVDISVSNRNAMKIKVDQNLSQHEAHIGRIIHESDHDDKSKKYLISQKNKIFNNLYQSLDIKPNDISRIPYALTLPKEAMGEYEVFLKSEIDESLEPQAYLINLEKTILEPQNPTSNTSLIKFANANIVHQNPNIALHYNPKNLILDSEWVGIGTIEEHNDETIISVDNRFSTGGYSRKINDYNPSMQYLVTFDYYTEGIDLIFNLKEKQREKNKNLTSAYFNKNLSSRIWTTSQSIVTSAANSVGGYVHFSINSDKDIAKLHIRNLSVIEVPNKKLFFKKIVPAQKSIPLPELQFKKINPTMYNIKVSNARDPYTLVFSESFSDKWKLYIDSSSIPNSEPATVSYFNGQIKEGRHTNSFFANSKIEKNKGVSISEENHNMGNGYANAWTISPTDGGKENYELNLVFEPQRYIYLYLIISTLTALSLLGYILFYKKNNK